MRERGRSSRGEQGDEDGNEMREFTPTEIELCKKIAEKEKREVESGDWYLLEKDIILCAYSNKGWHRRMEKDITPLWQEHDCLEWLLERGFYIERLGQDDDYAWSLEIYELDDLGMVKESKRAFGGESKLEPCQRAVLAVMEEKSE